MNRLLTTLLVTCCLLTLAALPAMAGDIRTEPVKFLKGATGATIRGRIKGRETVDYQLRARAGQRMSVNLETDNPNNYFNVLAPGETEVAFFVGSNQGSRFSGRLSESGVYTICAYLFRHAARRGERAKYKLEVAIAGGAHSGANRPGSGRLPKGDSLVPGTQFHATGNIPCARYRGQPMA